MLEVSKIHLSISRPIFSSASPANLNSTVHRQVAADAPSAWARDLCL